MRSVPEWVGKTDDTPIPARVQLRVTKKYDKTCQICFAPITSGVEIDHRVALVNGGRNAEFNLAPVHPKCHRAKTREDVAEKAATYRTQAHHLGIRKSRHPMPGSKASGWRKRMNGTVERRQQHVKAEGRAIMPVLKVKKEVQVQAKTLSLYLKVSDQFTARLLDQNGEEIFDQGDGYVPGFMPGEHYGDYVFLDIDIDTGKITNWKAPDAGDIEKWIDKSED